MITDDGDDKPDWHRRDAVPFTGGEPVHGAYSERSIAERAVAVREHLLEVMPWVDQPHFMIAVDVAQKQLALGHLAYEAAVSDCRLRLGGGQLRRTGREGPRRSVGG